MNRRIFIIIFIIPLYYQGFGQNLFDKEHSLKFTDYLFKTRQYNYAVLELERMIYMDSTNDSLKYLLLKSYRFSEQYEKGITRAGQIYPILNEMPALLAREYTYLLLETNSYSNAKFFLSLNKNLAFEEKTRFSLITCLLNGEWGEANNIYLKNDYQVPVIQIFKTNIEEGLNLKYKSPFLAASMSGIIPGSGKIYTGYWKDGLFSFFSIGVSSWQACNGFYNEGIGSTYGWIFGGFATILYLSNIYGSQKSAKVYNNKHRQDVIFKVKNKLYSND